MAGINSDSANEDSGRAVSFGGPVDKVKVSLRVFGDDLDPDEVSRLLGCEPSSETRKGDIIVGRVTGRQRVAPCGSWLLASTEDESVETEEQVSKLLSRLSSDLDVWKELTQKYRVDLFCGLFLNEFNRGFSLSSGLLKELAERNLKIEFDIYAPA